MRTEKPKKEKKNVFHILYCLNKIIDVNECEMLCNKKLKEDTIQYLKMNIQQKINAILQKDKTNQDLAKFHYVSL